MSAAMEDCDDPTEKAALASAFKRLRSQALGRIPPEQRLDLAADKLAEATVKVQRATAHLEAAQASLAKARQEQTEAEQEFRDAQSAAQAAFAPPSRQNAPALDPMALQNWLGKIQCVIQGASTDPQGNLVVNPAHMEAAINAAFELSPKPSVPAMPMNPVRARDTGPPTPTSSRYHELAAEEDLDMQEDDDGYKENFFPTADGDGPDLDHLSDAELWQQLQSHIPASAQEELRKRLVGKQRPPQPASEPRPPTKAERKAARKAGVIKRTQK